MKAISVRVFLTVLSFIGVARSQTTALYFTSSPRSWVGQGQTVFATTNGFVFVPYLTATMVNVYCNGTNNHNPNWTLTVGAPYAVPLTNGIYFDAHRSSQPAAALNFYGNGNGDNTTAGYFTVSEAVIRTNTIIAFAADFVQYDEQVSWNWCQGSIRYNSTVPIPQPLLFTTNLNGTAVVSWPVYATGFQLYSTSSLDGTNTWTPVASELSSNQNGMLSAVLPVSETSKFFRLMR